MDLNKVRTGVEEKFYNICQEVVKTEGYVLYEMEYISASSTLSVYIMNADTKTAIIEDCVKVDRAMSPYFEESWIPEDIVLEVSSPGVYRKIKTLEHFIAAIEERVTVSISGKIEIEDAEMPKEIKNETSFSGILKSANEENIILDINGYKLKLDIAQLKRAQLDPVL